MPRFVWSSYRYEGEHRACCLCASREAVTVGTRDRWFNPLKNVACTGCGLVRLDPMPTEAEAAGYYAKTYRAHYHGATSPPNDVLRRARKSAAWRMDLLGHLIAPKGDTPKAVLDFGCSTGDFLAEAAKQGADVVGIEPNEGYAQYGRDTHGLDIRIGGWSADLFEVERFDLITSFHVFEHLTDPRAAFDACWRWLRPGGHLFVGVPDVCQPGRPALGRWHFGHKHGFCGATLEAMGTSTGFALADDYGGTGAVRLFRKLDQPEPTAAFAGNPDRALTIIAYLQEHSVRRAVWKRDTYAYGMRKLVGHAESLKRAVQELAR